MISFFVSLFTRGIIIYAPFLNADERFVFPPEHAAAKNARGAAGGGGTGAEKRKAAGNQVTSLTLVLTNLIEYQKVSNAVFSSVTLSSVTGLCLLRYL